MLKHVLKVKGKVIQIFNYAIEHCAMKVYGGEV
jgi:hypothetical protein